MSTLEDRLKNDDLDDDYDDIEDAIDGASGDSEIENESGNNMSDSEYDVGIESVLSVIIINHN